MKHFEFVIYASAKAVDRVELFGAPAAGYVERSWTCRVTLGGASPAACVLLLDARGNVKTWKSLDTAVAWVRSKGYDAGVEVMGSVS